MTPMLNITRLHNAIASAAALRRGLQLARGYAAGRSAFGRTLDQLPLQRQVLSSLAVQAEAALALTMRLAAMVGRVEQGLATEQERLLFRLATSLVKLYTARQAVAGASEAVEAFGGAGYMEDTGIAGLLRDAQVLTIWEGTTNVLALDLLRSIARPGAEQALLSELDRLQSPALPDLERRLAWLARQDQDTAQRSARAFAFSAAEAWIAGLLRDAAGRGARELAVFELWQARDSTDGWARDSFSLVVDGE
jgi:acyl-CoA dehydrogenase